MGAVVERQRAKKYGSRKNIFRLRFDALFKKEANGLYTSTPLEQKTFRADVEALLCQAAVRKQVKWETITPFLASHHDAAAGAAGAAGAQVAEGEQVVGGAPAYAAVGGRVVPAYEGASGGASRCGILAFLGTHPALTSPTMSEGPMGGAAGFIPVDAGIPLHEGSALRETPMGAAAVSIPGDAGIPLHDRIPRREGPMGGAAGSSPVDVGIPLHEGSPHREGPMGGAAGSSPVDAGIPLHEGSPRREGPMGGIPLHDRTPPREGPMGGAAGSSRVDEEMQLDDESARKKVLTYTNPHPVALTSRGCLEDIDWHSDAADAMFVSRNSGAGRPRAMCARPSATRSPTSCLGFASCSLPRESRTALAR